MLNLQQALKIFASNLETDAKCVWKIEWIRQSEQLQCTSYYEQNERWYFGESKIFTKLMIFTVANPIEIVSFDVLGDLKTTTR